MGKRISLVIENHIGHVRLNRPEKMNALDPAMFDSIIEVIDELSQRADLRAIVLSGEGRGFCAGLDLASFQDVIKMPENLLVRTHGMANRFQQVAWGWRHLAVPVIAAVHGVAIGGGLNIMSGADIRIVHPDTKCAVMEMRWGLIPDMAGYPLWRGNVRDDVLRKLVYTHSEFSGNEAVKMGFATEASLEPLKRALEIAKEIVDKNPDAIQAAKRLSNAINQFSDEELLMLESKEQDRILGQQNQVEAVMSQIEGRRPNFG